MKEKFLVFKNGTKKRIIKVGPYIAEDPKSKYCDSCEYVTSDGNIYKEVMPGVKQVSHHSWYRRTQLMADGWLCIANIDKVVEEDDCTFTSNFALPEYCVLHGKKCDHCSCEVAGYCQARTSDPVDVFKSMQKRIDNLIHRSGDQDKEIIELVGKVSVLEKENTKLDKRNTNLNVEVLEKQEQIRKLEKDNYIANDNLTAMAAENMQLRDENTKLKEKVDVYNKEVKQWLNGFYGQPLQPLYCCIGRRHGGKTVEATQKLVDMYSGALDALKHEYAELEKENRQLRDKDLFLGTMSLGQFEELLEENKKLKKQNEHLRNRLTTALDKNVDDLTAENKKLKAKHQKATKKIEEMKAEYTELESKYNLLDKQSTKMIHDLKKENQVLKLHNDTLKKIDKELDFYKERCTEQKKKILDLEVKIDFADNTLLNVRKENRQKDNEIKALEIVKNTQADNIKDLLDKTHDLERKIVTLEDANNSLYLSYAKRGDEMYNYKKALALIDRDSVKHSGRGPSVVEAYGVYEVYGLDFCTRNKNDYTFVTNMLRKARK